MVQLTFKKDYSAKCMNELMTEKITPVREQNTLKYYKKLNVNGASSKQNCNFPHLFIDCNFLQSLKNLFIFLFLTAPFL